MKATDISNCNMVRVTSKEGPFSYHGTDDSCVEAILKQGLLRGGGVDGGRIEVFFSMFPQGTELSAEPWELFKSRVHDHVVHEPYIFHANMQVKF